MPRPLRSAARTMFAAFQLVLLGAALLGLRSPLEVLLGVVVVALLLLSSTRRRHAYAGTGAPAVAARSPAGLRERRAFQQRSAA